MLRDEVIRLARERPELRADLIPLLRGAAWKSPRKLTDPGRPKKDDQYEMNPNAFLGRWLMSRKGTISDKAMSYWAEKYPFSGWAFRVAPDPYDKPRGSWCRTPQGLIRWKMTMNPLGLTPTGFHNYRGHISKGIDLAAMAKGEGLGDDFRDTIVAVEEVTPLTRVSPIMALD